MTVQMLDVVVSTEWWSGGVVSELSVRQDDDDDDREREIMRVEFERNGYGGRQTEKEVVCVSAGLNQRNNDRNNNNNNV